MHLTNPDNDLFVDYRPNGESVIRTVSPVGGDGNHKTTFTRAEADKDAADLIENYDYREVEWDS